MIGQTSILINILLFFTSRISRQLVLIFILCLGFVTLHELFQGITPVDIDENQILIQGGVLFFLYLCGSIPFGLIIAKLLTDKDVRTLGSGNIGTTNVLRTGSKLAAGFTLLFDLLKGLLPLLALKYAAAPLGINTPTPFLYATFIIPVLGHMYPCWLNFKGGKGIATGLGVILAFSYPLALICLSIWIIIAKTTKMSSLAGLISFALAPLIALFFAPWPNIIWILVLSALVFFAHKDNIKRLLTGQEKNFGDSST